MADNSLHSFGVSTNIQGQNSTPGSVALPNDSSMNYSKIEPSEGTSSFFGDFFELEGTLIHYFSLCTQFLSWFVVFPIFHILFKINITGQENLKGLKGPLIVASNHICFYDSFFFRLILGFFSPLMPMRFMGVTKFRGQTLNRLNNLGIVPLVYALFGVFVITKGEGLEKGLQEAKQIIANGGIVAIYPEGKMIYEDHVGPFKRGTVALSSMTGAAVLPISLCLTKKSGWRKTFEANVGKPITFSQGEDYVEGSDRLQKVVDKLYSQTN